MSLSAWEQQALESIENGLAASDPSLSALLSAFTWLAADEEMPDREKTPAGARRPFRRRRARWLSGVCRACRRLGFQRAAMLVLWLVTTALLIAVVVALSTGHNHGSCTETAAMICVGPVRSTHQPIP